MTDELELLGKRFIELSRKADNGYYTFSDFLGLQEQAVLTTVKQKLYSKWVAFGGAEGAERVMVRFGDVEELGYEVVPIWSEFDKSGKDLVNAGISLLPFDISVDPHPNRQGHELIAKIYYETITEAKN